jgi:hypothetical protein
MFCILTGSDLVGLRNCAPLILRLPDEAQSEQPEAVVARQQQTPQSDDDSLF